MANRWHRKPKMIPASSIGFLNGNCCGIEKVNTQNSRHGKTNRYLDFDVIYEGPILSAEEVAKRVSSLLITKRPESKGGATNGNQKRGTT